MIVSGAIMVAFGIFLIWGARGAAEDRRADYKRRRRQRRKEKSAFTRFIMWEPRGPGVKADTFRTQLLGSFFVALGAALIFGPQVIG